MPIPIGVSLKEDSSRGKLQGVGGDGEGMREVVEVKDRLREEKSFETFKRGHVMWPA